VNERLNPEFYNSVYFLISAGVLAGACILLDRANNKCEENDLLSIYKQYSREIAKQK
jgi:hypothetical protein